MNTIVNRLWAQVPLNEYVIRVYLFQDVYILCLLKRERVLKRDKVRCCWRRNFSMAEITKIEKLDGKNYQSWKYNIKLVLMEPGLWGFIAGTETAPAETATVQVRNAYRLRSNKAYSLIALSVDKSLQVHITSTTDPRIAWETLQKQFEFISITQIARLNRKFYAATMKEGTDIIDHLTYMTSLAEQLRELKEEISDKKFATVVVR